MRAYNGYGFGRKFVSDERERRLYLELLLREAVWEESDTIFGSTLTEEEFEAECDRRREVFTQLHATASTEDLFLFVRNNRFIQRIEDRLEDLRITEINTLPNAAGGVHVLKDLTAAPCRCSGSCKARFGWFETIHRAEEFIEHRRAMATLGLNEFEYRRLKTGGVPIEERSNDSDLGVFEEDEELDEYGLPVRRSSHSYCRGDYS